MVMSDEERARRKARMRQMFAESHARNADLVVGKSEGELAEWIVEEVARARRGEP